MLSNRLSRVSRQGDKEHQGSSIFISIGKILLETIFVVMIIIAKFRVFNIPQITFKKKYDSSWPAKYCSPISCIFSSI